MFIANQALHWIAIPLRSISTSELDRYVHPVCISHNHGEFYL